MINMTKENKGEAMNTTSSESLFDYTRREVDSLLVAYEHYKTLSAQIASGIVPSEKPKFSLLGKPGVVQNLDPLAEARKRLEEIGNGMKFQNPLIWLTYKYEAYKDEEKPLTTVADLVAHCEVDGICRKRFHAITTYLREKYSGKDLIGPDTSSWPLAKRLIQRAKTFLKGEPLFNSTMSLEELAKDKRFITICFDLSFQTKWSRHENDGTGKWKHYAFEDEPAEKYSCGCC
jgi:hypothetical protein